MNFATAYRKMTGEWPTGLTVSGKAPKMTDVANWVPTVSLPYYTLGADIVGQVKDKVTVENTRHEEKCKGPKAASRSVLMRKRILSCHYCRDR